MYRTKQWQQISENGEYKYLPKLATNFFKFKANAGGLQINDIVDQLLDSFILTVYLLPLQWLYDLLHAHLQILDVVLLRLQQLLDHLGPLLQHPLLWILGTRAGWRG